MEAVVTCAFNAVTNVNSVKLRNSSFFNMFFINLKWKNSIKTFCGKFKHALHLGAKIHENNKSI